MRTTDPARDEFAHSLAGALVNSQYNLPMPFAPARPRHCLVTVGATAPFTSLVAAAFDPTFLGALINAGFTKLAIQAGKDADLVRLAARMFGHPTLKVECFDFVDDLRSVMVMCGKGNDERDTGVVICHAGTGTVLDAMALNVPLIVVPNPALQDNHQVELAKELDRQGYALHGDVDMLSFSLETHETKKSSFPTNTPANPVPVAHSASNETPTIWDVAHHMAGHDPHPPSTAGAPVVSVLDERDREALERLVEG